MKIGLAPVWMVVAVGAWIVFDISRGAMTGVNKARQSKLDETPLTELIKIAVTDRQDNMGELWSEHATIERIAANGNTIVISLNLTMQTEEAIEPRWAKNRVVGVRHDFRKTACKAKDFSYILSRGGKIQFVSADGRGKKVFPEELNPYGC